MAAAAGRYDVERFMDELTPQDLMTWHVYYQTREEHEAEMMDPEEFEKRWLSERHSTQRWTAGDGSKRPTSEASRTS